TDQERKPGGDGGTIRGEQRCDEEGVGAQDEDGKKIGLGLHRNRERHRLTWGVGEPSRSGRGEVHLSLGRDGICSRKSSTLCPAPSKNRRSKGCARACC